MIIGLHNRNSTINLRNILVLACQMTRNGLVDQSSCCKIAVKTGTKPDHEHPFVTCGTTLINRIQLGQSTQSWNT